MDRDRYKKAQQIDKDINELSLLVESLRPSKESGKESLDNTIKLIRFRFHEGCGKSFELHSGGKYSESEAVQRAINSGIRAMHTSLMREVKVLHKQFESL